MGATWPFMEGNEAGYGGDVLWMSEKHTMKQKGYTNICYKDFFNSCMYQSMCYTSPFCWCYVPCMCTNAMPDKQKKQCGNMCEMFAGDSCCLLGMKMENEQTTAASAKGYASKTGSYSSSAAGIGKNARSGESRSSGKFVPIAPEH